jgi:hypothetical protein
MRFVGEDKETTRPKDAWRISPDSFVNVLLALIAELTVRVGLREREKTDSVAEPASVSLSSSSELPPLFRHLRLAEVMPRSSCEVGEDMERRWDFIRAMLFSLASFSSCRACFSLASSMTSSSTSLSWSRTLFDISSSCAFSNSDLVFDSSSSSRWAEWSAESSWRESVCNLYAVCSLRRRPSAFMRRFLNAEGEKGSVAAGDEEGKRAWLMLRVRNSSFSIKCVGSCMVCCFGGLFGLEKKLNLPPVEADAFAVDADSMVARVGRFRSFAAARSGKVSRDDIFEDGEHDSGSVAGTPIATGALEPENHELRPPRGFSSILITPSRSPVNVGMNSSSNSICVFSFFGVFRSGLLELDFVRNGSKAVSDR